MIASGGIQLASSGSLFWTVAIIVVLFVVSFFFSGTETALFSLQALDRQRFEVGGRTGKLVTWLLSRRAATLTTILIGNEFANTALAATTASLTLRFFPTLPFLNILFLTPALVLISEITPKFVAIRTNRTWSVGAAYPIYAFMMAIWPIRRVFEIFVLGLARLFRADALAITEGLEEAELMILVDRGAAAGALEEAEREIIENVFELDELPIERVMTPRPDMFMVPLDITWEDLLSRCAEKRLSRIPVYDTRDENVVGILLVKDLLRFRDKPEKHTGENWLFPLLLPVIFVPSSKSSDAMFRDFLRKKYHMAVVVDEHGTVMGLVTLDDLVEELLGEPEPTSTAETSPGEAPAIQRVKASIDLQDFEEDYGIEIPRGDYHTLGGFIFHRLGRLPSVGDSIEQGEHRLTVVEMDGRRIAEVEIRATERSI